MHVNVLKLTEYILHKKPLINTMEIEILIDLWLFPSCSVNDISESVEQRKEGFRNGKEFPLLDSLKEWKDGEGCLETCCRKLDCRFSGKWG